MPFVFVSGAIGEELAIETLKEGATDYVLKQRLSRLVPSVRRALSEAEERSARMRAEAALRQSEEKHRRQYTNGSDLLSLRINFDLMHLSYAKYRLRQACSPKAANRARKKADPIC